MHTPQNSLRHRLKISVTLAVSLLLVSCAGNEAQPDAQQNARWQALDDTSCRYYYDGCNTCTRDPETGISACTRKSCEEYEEPRCLDGVDDTLAGAVGGPRLVQYRCAGNNRFRVYHGEYIVADTRIALEDDQAMFVDARTGIAEVLTRQDAKSGARYVSGDMTLWTKDDQAVVNKAGDILYSNCRTVESN